MTQSKEEIGIDQDAGAPAGSIAIPGKRKNSPKTANSRKIRKKDRLFSLLIKPNGARSSVIAERLGWQAHTVRVALSGLRKKGYVIVTTKSKVTGETVYSIGAGAGKSPGESGKAR